MSSQPIYFVTVDNAKEKARGTFGAVVKDLKDSYDLIHVANCETILNLKTVLASLVITPKVLIASSDWFEEEQEEIRETAKRILPDIHLIMVPPGLFKQEGETKVIEYLTDQFSESRLPAKA